MTGSEGVQPAGPDDPVSPSEKIEKGTDRFAGRLWSLQRVLAWMRDPDTRFFVLTGEPGAGKSALAAWMAGNGVVPADPAAAADLAEARSRWGAVHFCRAKAGGTLDPKTFAASISKQLTVRHPEFGELALRQLAPEIQVIQEVGENRGEIVGLKAEQVIVNSRDADDVYDKAVRKPLRDLAGVRPDAFPMFLLVDGLDEAWGRAEPNIVTLLERSDDLPAGVHVLVTSRNIPLIVERLADRTQLDLSGPDWAADNDRDVRAYVEQRLGEADLASQVAGLSDRTAVVDGIVNRAGGNFLFVEFLLDEAATGAALGDLARIPSGLYPLYRQYLDRLLPAVAQPGGTDSWVDTYRPLLGSLSVATPSAPEPALPRWLGWEAEDVDLRLGDVRQLWEEATDPESQEPVYRMYHRSLAEFLTTRDYPDGKVSTKNRYYAAPRVQHERIATYYLSIGVGADGDWTLGDVYGLRQVVPHLRAWLEQEDDPRQQRDIARKLYEVVLDPRLKAEQERRLGGVGATVVAFRIALETALRRDDLDVVERLVTTLAVRPRCRAAGPRARVRPADPGDRPEPFRPSGQEPAGVSPTAASAPIVCRRLVLTTVLLLALGLGLGAGRAWALEITPSSGPSGTTVVVNLGGTFSICSVSFDDTPVGSAFGCESLSFEVPESASVGNHQISVFLVGGEGGEGGGGGEGGAGNVVGGGGILAVGGGGMQIQVFPFAVTDVTPTTTTTTTTTPSTPTITTTTTTATPAPLSTPTGTVDETDPDPDPTTETEVNVDPQPPSTLPVISDRPAAAAMAGPSSVCPPRQVALTSFAVRPSRGRPGAQVLASTSWGSAGTCVEVQDLGLLFDGKSVGSLPPAAGTSGTFEVTVPDDAGSGAHRVSLVGADDSLVLATVTFDVEPDGGPGLVLIAAIVATMVALVLAVILLRRRRRRLLGRGPRPGAEPPDGLDPRDGRAFAGMDGSSPERWRTALKAAYFVGGEQGQEVFAWAAGSRNAEQRKTVVFFLYLLWRRDPAAVYLILDALAGRIGRLPVGRTSRLMKTLSDTSITIYVNHPEDPTLAAHVSKLWSKVLKGRLRVHRRRWLQPALVPILSTVLSRRILETALLGQDPNLFFDADPELRARFARVVPLADPSATFVPTTPDDLAALFESRVHLHNVLAALTVAIHAAQDFEATEPVVRDLHRRVDAHGRLWLLQAFSVLLPGTPPEWLPLLEELTTDLVRRDRETFLTRDGGQLVGFDIALLPLGLAYAKSPDTRGMPRVDAILAEAITGEDWPLVARVVGGLAPIGFHHADVLFRTLRPILGALVENPTVLPALVSTLADTRTLWFDEVDLFLREMGAGPELRQQVAAGTRSERMTRLVGWLGIYNNAVHQALEYPIMREHLLLGGLRALVAASSPRRFVGPYTRRVLRLLHNADYELIRWTEPGGRN